MKAFSMSAKLTGVSEKLIDIGGSQRCRATAASIHPAYRRPSFLPDGVAPGDPEVPLGHEGGSQLLAALDV
jgi:hypothetical protein